MELVGKTVKKEFPGLGTLNGIVNSYDPKFGFFEIVYEDGDSEEMDLNEVETYLGEKILVGEQQQKKIQIGEQRAKKKRRKSGNFSDSVVNSDEPQNVETLVSENENVRFARFDLNVDISMTEEEEEENGLGKLGERTRKVEHSFDINLGLEEEIEVEGLSVEGETEVNVSNACLNEDNCSNENNLKMTTIEETPLKDSNDLSEGENRDVCLKEGNNSSLEVEEIQLKDRIVLGEHVRGDACVVNDEGTQDEDRDLGGNCRDVASKDCSAYFHLKDGCSDVAIAQNHQDMCFLKPPDKGAGIRKKRGRPKKLKSTPQKDDRAQTEVWDFGESCRRVTPNDTGEHFHMTVGSLDVVVAENHEQKLFLEPLDKGSGIRKKRGSPKKLKSTPQTDDRVQTEDRDLGESCREVTPSDTGDHFHMKVGSFDVVVPENVEQNICFEPLDNGAGVHKKRGRPKKLKSSLQTDVRVQTEDRDLSKGCREVTLSNTGDHFHIGGLDVVVAENHEQKICFEPPGKEVYSRTKRGRPSKKLKSTLQTTLSMEIGSSDLIFATNNGGSNCLDTPEKEACSPTKQERLPNKLESVTQTTSNMEDGSDLNSVAKLEDRVCLQTPEKEQCSSRNRGRKSTGLNSTTQRVLRRSTRKSSTTSLNHVPSMDESLASNAASSFHEVNTVLDSNSEGYKEQPIGLPQKLKLPPSSKNLDIDGTCIIDIFSVYSCLRSFSTVLFLSPFSLEAFLEALKQRCANSLIDSIHFSLLYTLKLHMECLADEGSQSATNCLRSLNWEFLDVVTWPIYMVEYLLICGSALKPGYELSQLKVLMGDYYNQPPSLKIEVLRCLCDDVIEADSIRLELNRRIQASELDMDVDLIAKVERKRKGKDQMDDGAGSCLAQDGLDETADLNSDECCLCKMEGNLICCDGCPAAYHTRCVGITMDTLPEGEWFCPECVIKRYDVGMKSPKSLRGADLLGTDPHGRLYFGACGYLLVLDSCDPESSYNFYNRDDLNFVVEVLKSCDILYGSIINSISMNWDILGAKGRQISQMNTTCKVLDVNSPISATMMSSLGMPLSEMTEVKAATNQFDTSVRNEDFDLQGYKISESGIKYDSGLAVKSIKTRSSAAKCEVLAEISKVSDLSKTFQETGEDCLKGNPEIIGQPETAGETHSVVAEGSLQSTVSFFKVDNNIEAAPSFDASLVKKPRKGVLPQVRSESDYYVNYYTFGQTAASIVQEFMCKSPDNVKEDSKRSSEDILSAQMKAISKKQTNFCWSNIQGIHQNAEQEDCGWCFSCKGPIESETCLFKTIVKKPAPDGSKSGAVGLLSKTSAQSHIFSVICHILSIEERLSGLLSGPWRNATYSKNWRKNVLKAPDVASLKHLLITLESNLRRLALLPEWFKHVDSVVTMGSASHIMTTSVQVSSSKPVGGRKRAKYTVADPDSALVVAAKSSGFWWRGGKLSCQLFNYNVLPHSLASKGGRQAGCKKILGMLYPDGSEFAKRSKFMAWRASVEMSTSVPHLAYQVRELHSYIRWEDLENIQDFSHLSKESKKAMKLFKKVTIRRKCIKGTNIKYLLDFGKRRTIPNIVVRNGIMLEVSSSERKKYWLEESLVPLHILKAYEEKKQARTSSKVKPGPLDEAGKVFKKSSRQNGLLHLFSKAQKSEYDKCGHCNRDVLIRDAVACQDCEGLFHKRHVRKSEHSCASECIYQCQRCREMVPVKKSGKAKSWKVLLKKSVKAKPEVLVKKSGKAIPAKTFMKKSLRGKVKRKVAKKASTIELRQSLPRKVKHVRVQSKKIVAAKKRKHVKSKNQQSNNFKNSKKGICSKKEICSEKEICWYKGKRTQFSCAYWLNGVRLTRNLNDPCAVKFRESNLFLPLQHPTANVLLPKCCLCREATYRSTGIYVNCENCQEWFHGEAFAITAENSSMVLGFRCYSCRKRDPPLCPYLQDEPDNAVRLHEEGNDAGIECPTDIPVTDKFSKCLSHDSESVHIDQNTPIETVLGKKDLKIDAITHSIRDEQNAVSDFSHEKKGLKFSNSYHKEQREDEAQESTDKQQKEDEVSGSSQKVSEVVDFVHMEMQEDTMLQEDEAKSGEEHGDVLQI